MDEHRLPCARRAANWLIIRKPVEVDRSIEIRRDCMIIEGGDIFWLRWIETNWPAFQVDKNDEDNHILCGIYGTRFVEYLTSHHLDECDRAPEVLATHVHDAMTKLWSDSGLALDPAGSRHR
jgi:hypothetical protein